MKLENELINIEQQRDLNKAIQYLKENDEKNLDTYLRVIFMLLDFLVDGQYTEDKHDFISLEIKKIFEEAKSKYSDKSEFLFFSGIMIYIAEWYFGTETLDEATTMLKKAMDSEPENILYKWGYYSITDQRAEINTETKFFLSKEILEKDSLLKWIENKGLLGEYLKGIIEGTYETTKIII